MENLELYRIFLAVAESGSFTEAAKSLYITQPAVSQSIRQLEEKLGIRLFLRSVRGTELTAEGQVLSDYVRSSMRILEAGEEKLQKIRSLEAGELRIGAGDIITREFLLPFIERFHAQYPGVSLKVHNRTTTALRELLKSGQFDLAVLNLPIEEEGMEIIPCGNVQDLFVASDAFSSLFGKKLSYAELARQPLVMLEPKSNSRRFVQSEFLKHGVSLNPGIELGAYDLLTDFAKIGLGIACVTAEFSKEDLESGAVTPIQLEPPLPKRQIGICYLSGIALSPAAQRFIDLIIN